MNGPPIFSEEQLDFLREIVNIGGGNAAAVMEQMLGDAVGKGKHILEVQPLDRVSRVIEGVAGDAEACVYARLLGDLDGEIFFLTPQHGYRSLVRQLRKVTLIAPVGEVTDLGILAEFGNVLVGGYLAALHDFCRLNIYHTVPVPTVDMMPALLDEALARQVQEIACAIVIRNELEMRDLTVAAVLLIIPSRRDIDALVSSIDRARAALMGGGQPTSRDGRVISA